MKKFWRAVIEICFVIFLFYSNLLMSDYTRSGMGQVNGFFWALHDIFTAENFSIGIVSALIGYVVFEFLRKKL